MFRFLHVCLFAAFAVLAQAPAKSQTPSEIGRLATFSQSVNEVVRRAIEYSGELNAADTALADAIDGYAEMVPAIRAARAALDESGTRLQTLQRLADAVEKPALETARLQTVIDASAGLPAEILHVYAQDIETLRQRLALAESGDPDPDASAALDAVWAQNAIRQIEAENAMLEIQVEVIDPDHPQSGLSRAVLASNRAGLPMFRLLGPGMAPTPEDVTAAAAEVRVLADELDAALDDTDAKLRAWRFRSFLNPMFRRLVPLYDEAVTTERDIANTMRELADLIETQMAQDGYDPAPFAELDARMQAQLQRRAAQVQDRLAAIREISGN